MHRRLPSAAPLCTGRAPAGGDADASPRQKVSGGWRRTCFYFFPLPIGEGFAVLGSCGCCCGCCCEQQRDASSASPTSIGNSLITHVYYCCTLCVPGFLGKKKKDNKKKSEIRACFVNSLSLYTSSLIKAWFLNPQFTMELKNRTNQKDSCFLLKLMTCQTLQFSVRKVRKGFQRAEPMPGCRCGR